MVKFSGVGVVCQMPPYVELNNEWHQLQTS